MPEINFRWSFLAVLFLVGVLALTLQHTLDARPSIALPLTKADGPAQIGAEFANELLSFNTPIRSIGYPDLEPQTEAIINAALAVLPPNTQIVSAGQLKINRAHETVDLLKIETLDQVLNQLVAQRQPEQIVVLVVPTNFISHRMGENWIVGFEADTKQKVSTMILTEIAIEARNEERLSPKCYTSQRTIGGGVYDLGCLILQISRRAQATKLDSRLSWMTAEKEMPIETVFAYSRSTPP